MTQAPQVPDGAFPPEFVFGAATSSYQIEGACAADGRGESIWDRFSHHAANIEDGSSGDVACDHYHRMDEDVRLMRWLGLGSYRFSIAWPRILPDGTGAVNEAGLDFYDRLVDALLEAGITPFPTLYHWDLPQALEEAGGWPERRTAAAFVRYADVVTRRLGDRVTRWATLNEPWCASMLGYRDGVHAPGRRDPYAAYCASHHLLLSHGLAVPAIRANVPGAEVGLVNMFVHCMPASPSEADAAYCSLLDAELNRWFLDPIYRGAYPENAVRELRDRGDLPRGLQFVEAFDLRTIEASTDFLGVNYYSRAVARSPKVDEAKNAPRTVFEQPPEARTDMGWEVYPDGLREELVRAHRDYAPPTLLVTESGMARDFEPRDGRVRDSERADYLCQHLRAVSEAREEGVPVKGYFVWSLLDNFEWAHGYTKRFGIVHVDFENGERLVKDSGRWYRDTIAARRLLPIDLDRGAERPGR